jgi:hypothetical protein
LLTYSFNVSIVLELNLVSGEWMVVVVQQCMFGTLNSNFGLVYSRNESTWELSFDDALHGLN